MAFARILDLFDRKVDRHIEEVIKVDQTDAEVVRDEIEEYVATEPIRRSFERILSRFQETPNNPHEGVGVWVSGFFGAGKSSFAKILGYVMENRELGGTGAAALFGQQTADPSVQALLHTINEQIPARSVIFDVSTDQSVVDAEQRLTDLVYQVLLRELGYSTDREIADLEIRLEGEDRLTTFLEAFRRLYPDQRWDEVKEYPVVSRSMASAVLHELDPNTWPDADSWAHTPHPVDVSANRVAERAWELMRRRGDGRALVFVVDEVGQYVARSTEKMLDLQGLVQALGRVGKNRSREWRGQVWLVVTSQERLSEVVDNLEGRQVELARLRDRFPIEVDLAPSDIREVTSERVLKKRAEADVALRALFRDHRGKLAEATRLSGGVYGGDLDEESFVRLYPFLPYQIDLLINVVSGLRTQGGGASRHVGGANRTIIKLAQQVLINERTALGERPVGCLVTLDLVYDLLEGLVNTERRQDLHEIRETFGPASTELRVAKALALLQFVRQLPRSVENLAALLHPAVDAGPVRAEVEAALGSLEEARRVRRTEEGWELLSKAGKDWQEERRSIDGSPRRRREILEGAVERVLEDAPGYRHRGLKTFKALPVLHGRRVGRGDVEIRIQLVTDTGALEAARERARGESNTQEGHDALHWVVPVPEEASRAVRELERTEEMVRRYEPQTLSPEQSRLLSDEKAALQRQQSALSGTVRRVFSTGHSFFRGVRTPLRELGEDVRGVVSGALEAAVPRLYPRFDLVGASVRSGDPVRILESASMAGLPPVYYEGKDGLGLVKRRGGDYAVDTEHEALLEVLRFIQDRAQYEREAQGKAVENHFTGFGYGWDVEAVMLLAATLFRAAEIEVYHGRRYTSFADGGVREVFRKTQVFRSASLRPRGTGVDLPKLSACAQALQGLYGEQVAIEEGAIASEVRTRFPDEIARCHRVLGLLEAHGLPGIEGLRELVTELDGIRQGSAEETVLAFHGQLDSVREGLRRLAELERAVQEENLRTLRSARHAVDRLHVELADVGRAGGVEEDMEQLGTRLGDEGFPAHLPDIARAARAVEERYRQVEGELRTALEAALQAELDAVRNRPEWEGLDEEARVRVLGPFGPIRRKVEHGGARLPEMASDLKALPALRDDALVLLVEMSRPPDAPEARVVRIRASRFASGRLSNKEDVDKMLEALGRACREAIGRGETVVVE